MIYRSQPGLGDILGARVLAEFGDDPTATPTPKPEELLRRMSPITKASGTKRIVLARFAAAASAMRAVPAGIRGTEQFHRRPRVL